MKRKTTTVLLSLFFILTGNLNAICQGNDHAVSILQGEIDKAYLPIVYTLDQQATKDRDKIVITDTMSLDIAKSWSVYYPQ